MKKKKSETPTESKPEIKKIVSIKLPKSLLIVVSHPKSKKQFTLVPSENDFENSKYGQGSFIRLVIERMDSLQRQFKTTISVSSEEKDFQFLVSIELKDVEAKDFKKVGKMFVAEIERMIRLSSFGRF